MSTLKTCQNLQRKNALQYKKLPTRQFFFLLYKPPKLKSYTELYRLTNVILRIRCKQKLIFQQRAVWYTFHSIKVFDRPGVAGAVLQTALFFEKYAH